jgi:hypothetical protein
VILYRRYSGVKTVAFFSKTRAISTYQGISIRGWGLKNLKRVLHTFKGGVYKLHKDLTGEDNDRL